jgi:peptidoglycan/xylan/chitin deacetylase (PgdA/CDA1 family)
MMKAAASFIILLLYFLVSPNAAHTKQEIKGDTYPAGVTVLIYHRFGEDKYPSTNVSVERFREQMAYLKDNDFQVIPLSTLVDALKKNVKMPDRAVVITIDDGYRSVYDQAWPVLQEFGYPFTVFLYVKATENKHWNYLSWDQAREMKAAGVDFQNHGYAHHRLVDRPAEMNDEEYLSWIRADLAVSTRIMSEELKERPEFYAVPYGEYNQAVIDTTRSFGYEAIFMQDPGSVSQDTDIFSIPREPILGTNWSTLEHFQMILERVDLPIEAEMPAAGELSESSPAKFSARLLYPEHYEISSLGVYVSELGWQKAVLEGDRVSIANNLPLQRRINRVAVSGKEKGTGRTAIRFWFLVQEGIKESQ